jgi:hypothetical protein
MVVNARHYRKLTVKQSFDVENTLLDEEKVIDFRINSHDLRKYEEVV